jgi:hypothetical protein
VERASQRLSFAGERYTARSPANGC